MIPTSHVLSFLNKDSAGSAMKTLIIEKASEEAYNYFAEYVDVESEKTFVIASTNIFNIKNNHNKFSALINLSRTNDIRYINKFFEAVNSRLQNNDIFIGCMETLSCRMKRLSVGKIPVFGKAYFAVEFIFNRISPKVWGLKKIYFLLTRGRNRLLSKAEVLGRLVCCGFEIVDYKLIDGLIYYVVKKGKEPTFDMNPSYGPLYKMPRIGKAGKIIGVYKMRTMHPYAEYLQKYVYELHGTSNGDKANQDFRLTPWGKFFRKVWFDELPMIINLLKGDVKIVGVRPLSIHKFNMYPKEVQEKRCLYRPGLIPPFYADIPNTFDELLVSEMNYLNSYEKNPIRTDVKYFFKAFYNIVFKGARSK